MPDETLEKAPLLSEAERDIIAFAVEDDRNYELLNVWDGDSDSRSDCESKKGFEQNGGEKRVGG